MTADSLQVSREAAAMPSPEEVERLYAAASAAPPLLEPPSVARSFASLYAWARALPGAVVVSTRVAGALAGLAYGHPWSWAEQTDGWSVELRDRLGAAAGELEGSFAVPLLAVSPDRARAGLGRRLLATLLEQAGPVVAWLVTTDADTPARRLYGSTGWSALGHGPVAPDGRPGLVLVHRPG